MSEFGAGKSYTLTIPNSSVPTTLAPISGCDIEIIRLDPVEYRLKYEREEAEKVAELKYYSALVPLLHASVNVSEDDKRRMKHLAKLQEYFSRVNANGYHY